ncbi:MAG: hypothetical protein Ta2G_11250 [Termitinemataceae bacterium]|nr:MAG: hypothetical protein Ta2G_11250 [Termitinemataceae bacterium]
MFALFAVIWEYKDMKIEELKKVVGNNIKKYRKKKGLSQMEFADAVNVSYNFINDIERGKKGVSMNTFVKISDVLGLEVYKLFLPEYEKDPKDTNYPTHVSDFLKHVEELKRHYQ